MTNDDSSISKILKTSENNGLLSWSNFDHDLLFTVMMKLAFVDFFAFSGVCKSWRSLALANINKYMGSRQPMSITFSIPMKEWYFEDLEGRIFKTIFRPRFTSQFFVGLTCGYLIFFTGNNFWLVDLFTRHELYFPSYPFYLGSDICDFRGILVFSPSVSQLVFVFSRITSDELWFSLSGNQASLPHLTSDSSIRDIHFFKGKIYMLTSNNSLFEVRLDPKPTLIRLGMKNSPKWCFIYPVFVNSDKSLYLVDSITAVLEFYEIDLEKLEWVLIEMPILEYAFFVGYIKSNAVIVPDDNWDERRIQYERFGHLMDLDIREIKGRFFIADMWYFPLDLLNVNTLQLQ